MSMLRKGPSKRKDLFTKVEIPFDGSTWNDNNDGLSDKLSE
jgi:hypothetical protein